jgi:hypothetical protein
MGNVRNNPGILSLFGLESDKAHTRQYRLCYLDLSGQILKSDDIEVRDDLDALAHAQAASTTHTVELWQGERLVAKVDRQEQQSGRPPAQP